jgi:glucosylceramidase
MPLTYKMDEQPQVPITAPGGTATTTITVDPATTYQTMLGFGISMEEASVANIRKLSSAAKRTEFLKGIVDPVTGMGQNLFRVTMGTSDFTGQPWYSYDDGAADPTMARFSIQKDIDAGIIDVLKEMLVINPDVKFFGSVWSPPGWMKDSNTMLGGNLVSSNIPALAIYFRKFVEAYKAQGIPIYAVTLQNEPQHSQAQYPTCVISAAQEVELVKAVKAEFTAGALDTKIWVFDHNFDIGVAYSTTILSDPAAAAATDGVAWHDYGGLPTEMSTLHTAFPTKDIFFTEKTLWGVAGVERAAQYIRNWSKSYVSWLTMLDQASKPNNGPNTGKVRRFVKATTYAGAEYWPTAEHYLFGLYSKFVKRDAKRISSTVGTVATVTSVAFLNPDNSVVTVVMNQSATTQQFVLASEGNQIWSQLPAKTAATYVWSKGLGKATAAAVAPTN